MQKKNLVALVLITSLSGLFTGTVSADSRQLKSSNIDKPRGQLLYETHCIACHDNSVHNRNPRKADSVGKIKYWVTRWSTELKLNWSSSDIDEVAKYLNSKYYKFEE